MATCIKTEPMQTPECKNWLILRLQNISRNQTPVWLRVAPTLVQPWGDCPVGSSLTVPVVDRQSSSDQVKRFSVGGGWERGVTKRCTLECSTHRRFTANMRRRIEIVFLFRLPTASQRFRDRKNSLIIFQDSVNSVIAEQ